MITRARLGELLAGFPRLTLGLVGDLFLDRYLEIDAAAAELSIETGLEAHQVVRVRNSPGALGTVINNLAALGAGRLVPVTVLGDDGEGYDLRRALAKLPVDLSAVVTDPHRQTPTYTKPLRPDAQGVWQELNRLDLRTRGPLRSETQAELLERLDQVWSQTDGLVVLDQVNEEGWGVIHPRVREHLAELAQRDPGKLMFVDSRAQIHKFRAGTLKPNLTECQRALGRVPSDDPHVARAAAAELADRTGLALYCTLGSEGILVVRPGQPPVHVPAVPVAGPIDIVGAGDSATSGIVLALLAGADPVEAAAVGNLVASITIQQLGTTGTATPAQVLARWDETHDASTP